MTRAPEFTAARADALLVETAHAVREGIAGVAPPSHDYAAGADGVIDQIRAIVGVRTADFL